MNEAAQLEYDFQTLLDALGLVQGSILGILLMILNKRKYRSTFFLGLFLMLFSLKLIPFISISVEAGDVYPSLFLLPLNFSWLLFPLFFVYTQQISVHSKHKMKYWVLYPGIVTIFLQIIIYFLPYETKFEIDKSVWHLLFFTYFGIFYSWAIGIWNLKLLYQHKIEVQNSFSLIASKELTWARIFLIYSLTTSIIIHILFYISPQNDYYKIIFSIFDLIAIYWISYFGVVQRNVLSVLSKDWTFDNSQFKSRQQGETSTKSTEGLKELIDKIDDYMTDSESFINAELTVVDLAERLKVHPKRISNAINTICKKNFNSYVNQYRIKKAEKLLGLNKDLNLSMEGIGKEAGFNSKSAFYSAFKKVTGTTPTKYKEHLDA